MISYQDIPETIDVVEAQAVAYDEWEDSQRDTLTDQTQDVIVRSRGLPWRLVGQVARILLGVMVLGWATWQMIQSMWVAQGSGILLEAAYYLWIPWALAGFVWGLRFGKRGCP
jgi:uncharacterized membrane protein YcjF (UPF0283 family)